VAEHFLELFNASGRVITVDHLRAASQAKPNAGDDLSSLWPSAFFSRRSCKSIGSLGLLLAVVLGVRMHAEKSSIGG